MTIAVIRTPPQVGLEFVRAFWTKAASASAQTDDVGEWILLVEKVDGIVRGLVLDGLADPDVRQQLVDDMFFENMLAFGSAGAVPQIMADIYRLTSGSDFALTPVDLPSPHAVMLGELKDDLLGGLFSDPTPDGLTPWVLEPNLAGVTVANALKTETDPVALANLTMLLRDAAVPAEWARIIQQAQAFQTVEARLPREQWSADPSADLKARQTLQGLAAQAKARLGAASAAAALPSFPAGNRKPTPTLPPAPKPWWKRGPAMAGAVLGLFGGVVAANHRRRGR